MKHLLLAFSLITISPALFAAGKLLPVGGALSDKSGDVHKAFMDGRPKGLNDIVIIPVASGKPSKSAHTFKKELIQYGANEKNIRIFPLAVMDDSSTKADESQWKKNAFDTSLLSMFDNAGAVWFTGGDQMHIANSLYDKDFKASPLLTHLKMLLEKKNIIIAGTSAGAAMMSATMIAAGDSFSALTKAPSDKYYGMETQEQGQLYFHKGLGFFPYGVVDQHFDRKARLGRLVKTLTLVDDNMGYAVDENTGMLIDLEKHTLKVIGPGNVTIVNGQNVKSKGKEISNVKISVLSRSDVYNIKTHEFETRPGAKTIGSEYMNESPLQGAGIALPNGRLDQLLGYELLDNGASDVVRRYSFIESGEGVVYEFKQTKTSEGFWRAEGTVDKYSIKDVTLNIKPVRVTITEQVAP